MHCPVCSSPRSAPFLRSEIGLPEPAQVLLCGDCASAWFDPFPQPPHGPVHPSLDKYDLEYGAGIAPMLEALLPLRELRAESVLEIGGGFNFLLDAAGRWTGARRLVAIEPAPRTALFDHERIDGFFPEDLPDERFDLIIASEVLEHVPRPLDFLAAVLARLQPDGVALLTTPNAAVLRDEPPEHRDSILAAGQHMVIFSRQALRARIEELGGHCRIEARGGGATGASNLVATIAHRPEPLAALTPAPDPAALLCADLRAQLRALRPGGEARRWLRAGLLARLVEAEWHRPVPSGPALAQLEALLACDYGLDRRALEELPARLAPLLGRNLLELLPHYPCFLGRSACAAGFYALNGGAGAGRALGSFTLALRCLLLEQSGFGSWFFANRGLVRIAARHVLRAGDLSLRKRRFWPALPGFARSLAGRDLRAVGGRALRRWWAG